MPPSNKKPGFGYLRTRDFGVQRLETLTSPCECLAPDKQRGVQCRPFKQLSKCTVSRSKGSRQVETK